MRTCLCGKLNHHGEHVATYEFNFSPTLNIASQPTERYRFIPFFVCVCVLVSSSTGQTGYILFFIALFDNVFHLGHRRNRNTTGKKRNALILPDWLACRTKLRTISSRKLMPSCWSMLWTSKAVIRPSLSESIKIKAVRNSKFGQKKTKKQNWNSSNWKWILKQTLPSISDWDGTRFMAEASGFAIAAENTRRLRKEGEEFLLKGREKETDWRAGGPRAHCD